MPASLPEGEIDVSDSSSVPRQLFVGTDIGGTFTDLVVLAEGDQPRLFKSPTTPHNRAEGVFAALADAARAYELDLTGFCRSIGYFAHGTTAATNALIERKGARTALLTTKGFADTLLIQRGMTSWIGRGDETGHYSARTNPRPIIDRDLIVELSERVDSRGEVMVALDRAEIRRVLADLRERGVQALAVSFLWSFVNPAHEQLVADVAREMWPDVYLTLSHVIAPVIGEYERTATTVINSYLGPVIRDYVANLANRLSETGFTGDFAIMDSGGGVMRASDAATRSASMLTSGPAGGVLASADLAARLGFPNVITSDMGGTSFDVGLIVDGEPLLQRVSEAGNYHIASPRIQVTAIGAGGGSIAHVDEVGALVVGPRSAGADPGPACYGRGGTRPTVTDADVVLGIIDPDYFLGGRIGLDRALAQEAIRTHVAEPLGMSVAAAAAGIRQVADNQMADLLRKVTVKQGHDPRDFVVFAYGGAGPTHAYAYTQAAGIATLVVPPTSTVHSAYGAVTADRYRAVTVSDVYRTPAGAANPAEHIDLARLRATFDTLTERCHADLDHDQRVRFTRIAYLKFRKQSHELPVTLPAGPITAATLGGIVETFLSDYERIYGAGTARKGAGLEIHTLRVEGRVHVTRVEPPADAAGDPDSSPAVIGSRLVTFPETGATRTSIYRGEQVPAGSSFAGPAIFEFVGTTVVVGPGQSAEMDVHRNLIIDCKG
jgi:N-methylhydantoinase A